jgi:hypothetical protein
MQSTAWAGDSIIEYTPEPPGNRCAEAGRRVQKTAAPSAHSDWSRPLQRRYHEMPDDVGDVKRENGHVA